MLILIGILFLEGLLFLSALLPLFFIITFVLSVHFDVPFVPTPFASLSKVLGALDLQPGNVVYELGSGDGRLLLAAARAHPDVSFLGIERNLMLHWFALTCWR